MVGKINLLIQSILNRLGYQIRKLDPGVDFVDPYNEQKRLIAVDIKIIFEVGAADGRDCIRYLEMFPFAKVFAFEPVPHSYKLLLNKAKIYKNIHPFNLALSDFVGNAVFNIGNWLDTSSLLKAIPTNSTFDKYKNSSKSISVEVNTIDNFCIQNSIDRIELLKMDAQGSELKILEGAKNLLEKGGVDLIFTEINFIELYEGCAQFQELVSFLNKYNFYLHNIYDCKHNQQGRIAWGDAIFIRK